MSPAAPRTSPPLTYRPAYIGLFAALFLAAVCNTFLDIQYGGFAFESLFWALVFGLTLRVAWRQQGVVSAAGQKAKKTTLIIGILLSFLVFMPMWGFPRAGLAMLAMLQAVQNCVTVTRRGLHMGLLVSAVMAMFAASHYRADWTMLFYLVPYLIAVVFTLTAEQISRRAADLRQHSLSEGASRGQGFAIAAATAAILIGGATLYSITPQVTWPYLYWKYGQPGQLGEARESAEGSPHAGGQGQGGEGAPELPGGGLPSPADMRAAADRKGMPQWQAAAIRQLADATEGVQRTLQPLQVQLDALLQRLKDWLKAHWQDLLQALLWLMLLALLIAAWLQLREARAGLWLLARLDYLRLGVLRWHAPGSAGVLAYYAAMQRLMEAQGLPRSPKLNSREYLTQVSRLYAHVRPELHALTDMFEQVRYGETAATPTDLNRIRAHYRRLYRHADLLAPPP